MFRDHKHGPFGDELFTSSCDGDRNYGRGTVTWSLLYGLLGTLYEFREMRGRLCSIISNRAEEVDFDEFSSYS